MKINNQQKTEPPADTASWVDQFGDYLYGFASARVFDRSIAEDLVRETFLGALPKKTDILE